MLLDHIPEKEKEEMRCYGKTVVKVWATSVI